MPSSKLRTRATPPLFGEAPRYDPFRDPSSRDGACAFGLAGGTSLWSRTGRTSRASWGSGSAKNGETVGEASVRMMWVGTLGLTSDLPPPQ